MTPFRFLHVIWCHSKIDIQQFNSIFLRTVSGHSATTRISRSIPRFHWLIKIQCIPERSSPFLRTLTLGLVLTYINKTAMKTRAKTKLRLKRLVDILDSLLVSSVLFAEESVCGRYFVPFTFTSESLSPLSARSATSCSLPDRWPPFPVHHM